MQKLKLENVRVAVNASFRVLAFNQEQQCYGAGWHIHPEYELVYIRNGSGVLNIDTKSVPYRDGVLVFIGPDIPHTDFGNTDHADGIEIVVQFGQDFLRNVLEGIPEFADLGRLMRRSRQVLLFPPHLHKELGPDFVSLPALPPAARLLTLLACLLRMAPAAASRELFPGARLPEIVKAADAERLQHVFARVNQHFGNELTSGMLAGELGMTTNSFCRFFKASTQRTFTTFLNAYHLEQARDLLVETDRPVQEIMYTCGFRDAPYFSRAFRRFFGAPPTTYRASVKAP